MKKNFFVSTPIYYVNGDPHVGSAYTTIAADVINRYNKAMGMDTHFVTGLDEHGQKVEQAAEQNGYTPQAWTDKMTPNFKNMWAALMQKEISIKENMKESIVFLVKHFFQKISQMEVTNVLIVEKNLEF